MLTLHTETDVYSIKLIFIHAYNILKDGIIHKNGLRLK